MVITVYNEGYFGAVGEDRRSKAVLEKLNLRSSHIRNRHLPRKRPSTLSSEEFHRKLGLQIGICGGGYGTCGRSYRQETWKAWCSRMRLLYHGTTGARDHVRRRKRQWRRSLLAHTLQDDLQTGSYDLRRRVHKGILSLRVVVGVCESTAKSPTDCCDFGDEFSRRHAFVCKRAEERER